MACRGHGAARRVKTLRTDPFLVLRLSIPTPFLTSFPVRPELPRNLHRAPQSVPPDGLEPTLRRF